MGSEMCIRDRHGSVNETVEIDKLGVLYSTKYSCDTGYTPIGGATLRICNPKAVIYKDGKAVQPNQYSGEAPECKSTYYTCLSMMRYKIYFVVL